ncbi:hypothetical protein Tco_0608853 [Tanacetum coccineum]
MRGLPTWFGVLCCGVRLGFWERRERDVRAPEEVGEGSAVPTDTHHTTTQPSTSRPQKKQSRRKQRKDIGPTEPITDEVTNEEHVSTPSYDPSQSGEDRMQLNELMDLCAKLSDRVLALENTNTSQATKSVTLKESVKKLEKKRRSKTYKPRRLHKVGLSRRIESSDDVSLGTQEDANELMDLYAKLSDRVLTLENTNTSQVAEIVTLKESVKKLEKKRRSKTYKPKRLYKVGLSRRTSDDASLGAQEDASKQGRKIADLDADTEVTLNDETQGRNDEDVMFDT